MRETITRNLDIVDRHFAAETRSIDQALDLYTDDIVWEMPSRGLMLRGKDEVARNYRMMFSSVSAIVVRPLDRFATEDRVVDHSIVEITRTRAGSNPESAPHSTRMTLRLLHVFHMREGKIAKELVFEGERSGTDEVLARGRDDG